METIKKVKRDNKRNLLFFIVIIIFVLAFSVIGYIIFPKITNNPLCNRTSYYNIPEEFKRSISLILQRTTDEDKLSPENQEDEGKKKRGRIGYCLDIQYSDLSNANAEGIFYMDTDSKPDRLKIYVDQSYKHNDDLLTSIVLSHEITHALQYYDDLLGENNILFQSKERTPENNCYDKEIEAFMMQYVLLTSFNDEEIKSIIYRLQQNPYSNASYGNLIQLIQSIDKTHVTCGSYKSDCSVQTMLENITRFVKDSPFYQKQCQVQQ